MAPKSSRFLQCYGYDLLLGSIAAFYVFMVPYTKVEESFNVQAIHDILYHRHHFDNYDHLEFPGVVPRTFIGALFVSVLAAPIVLVMSLLQLPKIYSLIAVRLALGGIILSTLRFFRLQVRDKFGHQVEAFFVILTAIQFHLLFYSTRPLPNILALGLVNLAYGYWFKGNFYATLNYLIFATIIFRCDMLLFLGPICLELLLTRSISLWEALKCCIRTAALCIGLTILVDSFMWKRVLWPEFEVLWFNSVLNRSSEWGVSFVEALSIVHLMLLKLTKHFLTSIKIRDLIMLNGSYYFSVYFFVFFLINFVCMPAQMRLCICQSAYTKYILHQTHSFHWYFTSALPRSLLTAYPLFVLGVLFERRALPFILPVFSFVLLYSKLPHKELRFIISSVPMFNVSAAIAANRIYNNRKKTYWRLLYIVMLGLIFISLGCTTITLMASYENYPSGSALKDLHRIGHLANNTNELWVHIDPFSAMNGISHFCENDFPWRYSKEEGIHLEEFCHRNFAYLVNEHLAVNGYQCLFSLNGFSRLHLKIGIPPILLVKVPKVYVHGNMKNKDVMHKHWPGCA